MREQLLLFRARSEASFANFFVSSANASLIYSVRDWMRCGSGAFYVYGAAGSGRSHLLQAVSREAAALYLPLIELREQNPQAVLEGLEGFSGICLDDIHAVIEDADWCESLFHLFNRCLQSGAKLLISADRPSAQLPCALPDLQSRLRASGDFRMQALGDGDLAQALQLRAREFDIELSEEVVAYILARQTRAFPALFAVLEQLDKQSLTEKKRITVPFIRRVLDHST
jgi:DnaA family protein